MYAKRSEERYNSCEPFCAGRFVVHMMCLRAFGLLMAGAMVLNAAAQQSVPSPAPDQRTPAPIAVVFQDRIPAEQLALLKQFEGMPSGKAMKDKQFHEVLRGVVPDCDIHYGWDMPLMEALDAVMEGSKIPVQIRDGRYLIVSGRNGPYLDGRGLIWIDLQQGIGLGGFYFHPPNGESVAFFSQQVRTEEKSLAMGQLPVAFVNDLGRWSDGFRVPAITTRYFLTGSNLRVLLEHDEDYCRAGPEPPGPAPASGRAARRGGPGASVAQLRTDERGCRRCRP